jgi:hypothetical protein
MSMIVIGLSLPILKQRWCCLLYDVYCCMWITGSKYLEFNSSIRTENMLSKRTKSTESNKALKNKSWTTKTGNKQYRHWMVECFQKGWIVNVQYVQGLNIFEITELTIATLFCSCVSSWGIGSRAAESYFLLAGSLMALLRMIKLPSTLYGLMLNLQSNTSQNSIIAMIVSRE